MSIENVKAQDIYAAFGRGDTASILDRVSDETEWSFNGGQPDLVPYHRPYRGKAELPQFFATMAREVEFRRFEPREFVANGPHVVVEVCMAFENKRTKRSVDQTQLHWWTFDAQGKVARLVHYEDTAQTVAAARG